MDSRGQVVLEVRLVVVLLGELLMSFRMDVIRIHILRGDGHILGLPEQINENGYKYNTELKISTKNPPKVTVEKSDEENEFSGVVTKFAAQGF